MNGNVLNSSPGSDAWAAHPLVALPANVATADIPRPDDRWRPLGQPWLADGPAAGFQPGWARIGWNPAGLVYEAVFAGRAFRNAARSLNELTWELGDVCEIFVQPEDAPHYLEVHVTPENQRLQLRLPPGAIAAIHRGQASLDDFMVPDPDWVQTGASSSATQFHVRAIIPAAILDDRERILSPATKLRTCVCRYDYGDRSGQPLLSTTAMLPAPTFHDREHWNELRLLPPVSDL